MMDDQADDDIANDILWDALSEETVWIYIDFTKQLGDKDHVKVFATEEAAEHWFAKHDPEGVAFEYPVVK
jgi:hypothetical protein